MVTHEGDRGNGWALPGSKAWARPARGVPDALTPVPLPCAVSGPPLGTFACDYPIGHIALAAGNCVILFSDGLTEARRSAELFGERRLLETLCPLASRSPQPVVDRVREEALQFAGRLSGDMQILAFRLCGPLQRDLAPSSGG
jgi:hypothetical protein